MILPYFLLYVAFGLFPILFSLGVSFTSWDGIGEMTFVGLKNYVRVFTQDKYFYKSLWNTLILLGISTPIQIALGLLTATFLKDFFKKSQNGLQLINFLPYITTPVAVGIIFQLMFDWKSVRRRVRVLAGTCVDSPGRGYFYAHMEKLRI